MRADGAAEGGGAVSAVPLAVLKGGTTRVACPRCGTVLPQSRLRTHQASKRCGSGLPPRVSTGKEGGEEEAVEEGVEHKAGSGSLLCPFPDCGKMSPNLKALRKHYSAKHGEQRHTCKVCAKTFGRSDLLSRHAKSCGQPAQWACVCKPDKCFTSLFNLTRHIAGREDHYNVIAPGGGGGAAGGGTAAAPAAAGAAVEEGEGEAPGEEEDLGAVM